MMSVIETYFGIRRGHCDMRSSKLAVDYAGENQREPTIVLFERGTQLPLL